MPQSQTQTGIKIDVDCSTERFTWQARESSLALWQTLIPDTTFDMACLPKVGVSIVFDDNGKLRSDWQERVNPVATVLYGNEFGLPLCLPDAQMSGPVLVVAAEPDGEGYELGLSEEQLGLIESLATKVRGKAYPSR